MPASITITGHTEVQARLTRIAQAIPKASQQALHNAATNVVTVAKTNAPYLTGYLRANITIESESPTNVTIVSGAEYSIYQQVDFMGMALQSSQTTFLREVQTAIAQAIK